MMCPTNDYTERGVNERFAVVKIDFTISRSASQVPELEISAKLRKLH
jgi:hypothetical protein